MALKPGDAFGFQFTTRGASGSLASADSLPTGRMVRNGIDDSGTGTTITVVNVSAGLYRGTGTVPVGYASGDTFQVRIAATVGGLSDAGHWQGGVLDAKRVGDLHDASASTEIGANGLDAVLDAPNAIDGGSIREALQSIAAVLAGEIVASPNSDGTATATSIKAFKDAGTVRITATATRTGRTVEVS